MNRQSNAGVEFILNEPANYDVYKFCKENDIECDHDSNAKSGTAWTDIYVNGEVIFQIDHKVTKIQFINAICLLKDNFNNEKDFEWMGVVGKRAFNRFMKKHGHIFILR